MSNSKVVKVKMTHEALVDAVTKVLQKNQWTPHIKVAEVVKHLELKPKEVIEADMYVEDCEDCK